jgi:GntR family transcriptional regulator/MocR family aminotransferase
VTATGLAAGFHAVANLAPGVDGEAVAAAARERSVRLYPIGEYGTATGPDPRIVLGFGNIGESAIERGIERVADLLSARH